jgi:hypothetical protein
MFRISQKALIRHRFTNVSEIKRFVYKTLLIKGGPDISVLHIFIWAFCVLAETEFKVKYSIMW